MRAARPRVTRSRAPASRYDAVSWLWSMRRAARASNIPAAYGPRGPGVAAAPGPGAHSATMTAQSYWQETRAPRYSLLFALPLLLGYEALALALARPDGTGVRNGADVLLKAAFVSLLGDRGPLVFELLLIGVGVALVARDLRSHGGSVSKGVFAFMLAEAGVLALVCGVVVGGVTSRIVGATGLVLGPVAGAAWPTRLMLSLGAG